MVNPANLDKLLLRPCAGAFFVLFCIRETNQKERGEGRMEKPQKPTAEKQPKLGITDFAALYQLSMRSFFWKIDGRQGMKTLGKQSGDSALLTAF